MSSVKTARYDQLQQRYDTLASRAKNGQSLIPDEVTNEVKWVTSCKFIVGFNAVGDILIRRYRGNLSFELC